MIHIPHDRTAMSLRVAVDIRIQHIQLQKLRICRQIRLPIYTGENGISICSRYLNHGLEGTASCCGYHIVFRLVFVNERNGNYPLSGLHDGMRIHLQLKAIRQIGILHRLVGKGDSFSISIFISFPDFLRFLFKGFPSGYVDAVFPCVVIRNRLVKGITAGNMYRTDTFFQRYRNTHRRRIVLITQRDGGIIGFNFIFQKRITCEVKCFRSILLGIQLAHDVILNRKLGQAFVFCNRSDKVLFQNMGYNSSGLIKF